MRIPKEVRKEIGRKSPSKKQLAEIKKIRDAIVAERCNRVPGDMVFAAPYLPRCIRMKGHAGPHASLEYLWGGGL